MESILKQKRGQLSVGDAPGVVLIVLFLFMVIGVSAFVMEEYQDSFSADKTATVYLEAMTAFNHTHQTVGQVTACNFGTFAILNVTNATGGEVIVGANYTSSANGEVWGLGVLDTEYNHTLTNISYTYAYAGTACNVTGALTQEIEDNTSIAGMILTIALIGIVLSILIGLFFVFTRQRGL